MFKHLFYGNNVIELVTKLSRMDRTVLVIRHSERPSFDNIPMEDWNNIGLTSKGVKAAKDLGKALAKEVKISSLSSYGWGLKRCIDTAEAIAAGADGVGCEIRERGVLRFDSPIADRNKYDNAIRSGHWAEFVASWLSGEVQQNAMVPVDKYAPEIFRGLLDSRFCGAQNTSIIVTHDLHILPLVNYVFDMPVSTLDYLDGIVIKSSAGDVQIGFGGMFRQLEYDLLR